MKPLETISWPVVIVLCLTLGLAPWVPEPHIWEKIRMLLDGELTRAIDMFDMLFHGVPWLLLVVKAVRG